MHVPSTLPLSKALSKAFWQPSGAALASPNPPPLLPCCRSPLGKIAANAVALGFGPAHCATAVETAFQYCGGSFFWFGEASKKKCLVVWLNFEDKTTLSVLWSAAGWTVTLDDQWPMCCHPCVLAEVSSEARRSFTVRTE